MIKIERAFIESVEKELRNILEFWQIKAVDHEKGGFYGLISDKMEIDKNSSKGLILNTRILWTFARAYNFFYDKRYLETAETAYVYIMKYFYDNTNKGFFWELNADGSVKNGRKQIYGQAFAVYALSEYYIANKDKHVLETAKETFDLIEKHAFDKEYNGYTEAFAVDWGNIEDVRLSPVDLNEKKSMNTHLHILEAYTTLYEAWGDMTVGRRLENLVNVMIDKIIFKPTLNMGLFFDEKWTIKSDTISYGHEIEGAWLIDKALLSIGTGEFRKKAREITLGITENVYNSALDGRYGINGINNEKHVNKELDTSKIWWVQAEACVGFLNAYQASGKKEYLQAVYSLWNYIERRVIDKENGEWYLVTGENSENTKTNIKAGMWKCPYHNSRACIEILERAVEINNEKGGGII